MYVNLNVFECVREGTCLDVCMHVSIYVDMYVVAVVEVVAAVVVSGRVRNGHDYASTGRKKGHGRWSIVAA